jgi:hypothetical protein
MHSSQITRRPRSRRAAVVLCRLSLGAVATSLAVGAGAQSGIPVQKTPTPPPATPAQPQAQGGADPRVGLGAGWTDAKEAARNLRLVAHRARAEGFVNATDIGDPAFWNADLAFRGTTLFQGGFNGLQVWDLSTPANPTLRASWRARADRATSRCTATCCSCPWRRRAAASTAGRRACTDTASAERFRGVRIFDVSDVARPRQVGAVQTCRGSHTHTLVPDPRDSTHVYVYVSGTGVARPASELAGCSGGAEEDPNTSYFRIEVIRVPLARPQEARVVNAPRIFADSRDRRRSAACGRGAPTARGHSGRRRPRSATTSPRTPRSGSRRGRARATASCSTSATRPTRAASTR